MTTVHRPTVTYRRADDALTCRNISISEVLDYCDDLQGRTEAAGFSTVRALALLAQVSNVAARESRISGDLHQAQRETLAAAIFSDRLRAASDDVLASEPIPYALARAVS